METRTADFSVQVQGVKGLCPAEASMDDVPEDERKAVARQVADKIVSKLKEDHILMAAAA